MSSFFCLPCNSHDCEHTQARMAERTASLRKKPRYMTFPFLLSTPRARLACVMTLDEAIAYARYYGEEELFSWASMTINHDDGRVWRWEIKRGKPHLVEGAA